MRKYLLCLLSIALVAGSSSAFAETRFTYRAPENSEDARFNYDIAVMKLALEKTRASYGDFAMLPSPEMNFARAERYAEGNLLENFIFKQSYSAELADKLSYIPFPVDLGIVGYRICFVAPQKKKEISLVQNIEALKQYTFGQGKGWRDVEILKNAGFRVLEHPVYKSLFGMVALNRVDLFCRGINELFVELDNYRGIKDLDYDKSFTLAYPLPRFFFTHPSNELASKRMEEGLKAAHADGSLLELWKYYYKESVEAANLSKRRHFEIDNPLLKGIDPEIARYYYRPD